jgi:hypothetical protein
MNENATESSDTEVKVLPPLREQFIERVWIGLTVVASLAIPLSLARSFFTGWQPAFVVQLLMLAVLGVGYLMRARLSFRERALIMVVLLDLNGLAAVLSFGLYAASWWWLFMSSLLVAFFFRTRAGLLHAIAAVVVLCGVAVAFITGTLRLAFDANAYHTQVLPWVGAFLGPVLFTVFVFWACDAFLKAVPDVGRKEL